VIHWFGGVAATAVNIAQILFVTFFIVFMMILARISQIDE